MMRIVPPLVGSLVARSAAFAGDLPQVKPEEAGLAPERVRRITDFLKTDSEKGRIPGAVALLARDGRIGYFEAVGQRDVEKRLPMEKDSLFLIYSMTKPITSVAVMMLWEEGRFRLTDPVSRYIPAMKDMKVLTEKVDPAGHRATMLVPMEREITIQDLLRHTSGLTYGRGPSAAELKVADMGLKGDIGPKNPLLALTNAEVVQKIAQAPLLFQPGTSWEYGRSTDVLGHLVEVISGTTLDKFFADRIFKPLGMTDTAFAVPKENLGRVAHTATDPDTGKVPELWDPVVGRKFLGGGEGLVSTAADYVRFAQMLLNGGALGETRLLARKTVEFMTSDHLGALAQGPTYAPGPGYGFGLGFAVRTATGMSGIPGSVGEYNWGGAAGTAFWIDPQEKLIAILMLQAPEQRLHYRYAFRSLAYQALE